MIFLILIFSVLAHPIAINEEFKDVCFDSPCAFYPPTPLLKNLTFAKVTIPRTNSSCCSVAYNLPNYMFNFTFPRGTNILQFTWDINNQNISWANLYGYIGGPCQIPIGTCSFGDPWILMIGYGTWNITNTYKPRKLSLTEQYMIY